MFLVESASQSDLPDIECMQSWQRHNSLAKTALDVIHENPEYGSALAARAMADVCNAIMDPIDDASRQLVSDLRSQGLVLCMPLARIWVCEQLERRVRAIGTFYAGSALADDESKSNVCRAAAISPAAFAKHWPEAEKIRQATSEANETGKSVSTTLGGQPFDVYPMTPAGDRSAAEDA